MFEYVANRANRSTSARQLLDDLGQDFRYAARQLRRAPAFATLVIATLAIGIGANATMVGVIDRLLFRAPAEVADADKLSRVLIHGNYADGTPYFGTGVDYPTYLDFVKSVPAFSSVAGAMSNTTLAYVSNDPAAEVRVSMVTANFFQTLGVRPALGSFFSSNGFPTTAQSGGPALAVISHAFWQRELGASPAVIGTTIRVGKLAYAVVGVAPPEFRGVATDAPDLWIPITVALETEIPTRNLGVRDGPYLQLIGRLARGASRNVAAAQGTIVYRAIDADRRLKTDKTPLPSIIAAPIVAGRGPDAPREIKITLWLGGVSALVLLIVCANVANLLLGRAFTRRREIAVRLALGAGRARLARQLLTEALLLSAIGGACGLYLAAFGGRAVEQWLNVDSTSGPLLDVRLVLFTLVATIGTGVVVSLVPMLQSTSPNLSNGLRASTGSASGRGISVRSVLLATQAAMCVVLLIGAGLFAQSLRRVQQLDLGVDLDHTLQISMFGAYYMNMPTMEANAMLDEVKRQVDALPGVRRSAFSMSVFGGGRAVAIHTMDKSFDEIFPPGSWNEAMYEASVDSGMFQTLGVTSLRGRDFNSNDRLGAQRVTILNLPLAKKLFPNGDALGQCVVLPVWKNPAAKTECVRVVGVLGGYYRRSLIDREGMVAFIPLAQQTMREPAYMLYASTVGNADQLTESVRKIVRGVRPDLRRLDIKSMRQSIEPQMRPWNLAASMFVLFGAVALLVATIGLYAVVSFSVAQRTTEIAVRLALGARTHHIGATVGTESLIAVSTGLGVGVLVALLVRKSIGTLLFQTSPNDPFVLGGVAATLFTVAVIAMIVPLIRALRVNPSEVMRQA